MIEPNKLYTCLERSARDKHFSLLVPFVSYGENKVLQKQALIFGANIKTTFQVCKQTNA